MEVIHVVLGKANPDRMNGVNKVVYQMASHQAEIGMNVAVWGITSDLTINFAPRNFSTVLFPKSRNPFGISKALRKALQSYQGQAVFHLHGGWIPFYSSFSKVLQKKGIPYVITPHGAYNTLAMQRSYWRKYIYFLGFEKRVLQNAHSIHCLGESEVEGLARFYPNAKSVQLPYGFAKPQIPARKEINPEACVFGYIGRLDIFTKGLDLLLAAFAQVQSQIPKAQLWIVGDGESLELQKHIQQNQLEDAVTWLGARYGEEKNKLLSQMDIFLHPSRNEGLPTAVLEAAAFGKPCIVTQATNVGSYITQYQAGICVPNSDIEALGKAMVTLYQQWENPLVYRAIEHNAQQMVERVFNWESTLASMNQTLYTIS